MYVFFSTGEPSGDQHAAHLISEFRRRDPHFRAGGFGGPCMEAAGVPLLFRLTDLAVMAIFRVVPMLLKFWRVYKQACVSFDADRPDAVVLIDFPGFNWYIARAAKKRGIRVFYYMPPQLWAWAPWRIKKVRKSVDTVLTGLPFERDWFAARGVDTAFVGHPFFDAVAEHRLDQAFLAERRGTSDAPLRTLGVLPGSRMHELERNWPAMLEIVRNVTALHPDVALRVACYSAAHRDWLTAAYEATGVPLPLEFCVGKTPEVIELADCCLMVSGSVSLELLARRTPGVVIYKGGPLLSQLAKVFLTCPFITLPNLIAGRMVMPEFFYSGDDTATIAGISRVLDEWFNSPTALAATRRELTLLAEHAAITGGTARAVDEILQRLDPVPLGVRRAA